MLPLLRLGTAADCAAAVAVWRAAEAGRGLRPSAATVAQVEERVAAGLLVVAEADGGLVGMALGEAGEDPEELLVAMLFVAPPVQRQGIGAALVEGLADAGWARGSRSASVWTRTPEFYEACGFERTGASDGDTVRLTAELEAPLREVHIASDGIKLGQLLKLAELVETGSEGKELLAAGAVEVNGEVEVRRGRQVVDGDEIRALDQALRVVKAVL